MRLYFSALALLFLFAPYSMQAQTQQCMGFDGLSGSYGATSPNQFGQVFLTEGDITLAATGFVDTTGNVTNTATFWAGTFLFSGAFTLANTTYFKTNPKANLIIGTLPASEVTFDFIDWNSIMNFSVNGEPISVVDNLSDLPAAIAPGVTLSLNTSMVGPGIVGTVTLTGYITEVIIGGDNMGIDDICFVETAPLCQITSLTATPSSCDQTGDFTTVIDFDYANEGANGFIVTGNGTTYGTFDYGALPITLGPLSGDGVTDYEFFVEDVDNPNCSAVVQMGPINCPVCGISNIVAVPTECLSPDYYTVVVDFEYENPGGIGFDIFLNGQYLEYWTYAELPITMLLPATGSNSELLTFCDDNSTTCCSSITIQPLDCGAFDCAISNVVATPSACDAQGFFSVDLNFNYENAGNSFTVLGNGVNYGTYFYAELPITIDDLFGDNSTVYEFVVTDSGDAECTAFGTVGPINCPLPCELLNVTASPLQCTSDSTLSVMINLESSNGGSTFDVYTASGNLIGTYSYSQLPITIDVDVYPGQTTETLNICDFANPNCCISVIFDTPNCTPPACEIGGLIVTPTACDALGDFGIILDFDYANTGSQFSLYINGSPSGTFTYASLPLTFNSYLTGDGTTAYSFSIQDFQSPNCTDSYTLAPVECTSTQICAISNIVVDPLQCTSESTYSAFINFDYENVGANGFDVFIAGASLGFYDYTDLPLTLTNVPSSTNTSEFVIICDVDNPDCCAEINFMPMDCTPTPVCELGGLEAAISPCDSDGFFSVSLNFDYVNASATFNLAGNGTNYGTFSYADLPINTGLLEGDAATSYEFVVTDSDHPNCSSFIEIGTVNCVMTCELFTPVVDPIQCTSDSTYSVYIDFDFANVSGSSFSMFANGAMIGTYNYLDLPMELQDFPTMGSDVVQLTVCDNTDPNCCTVTSFESMDCVANCNIFDVYAEPLNCDQGLFLVEIGMDYLNPGPLGFQIFGNGTNYGNYSYDDLPVTIGALEGNGVSEYEFVVVDLTNTDCSNYTTLNAVNCLDECIITDLVATPLNCTDGEFMVTLSFTPNNVSSDGYTVYGNGTVYGAFSYDNNALIGPFPGDGQTVYEFLVADMLNDNCVAETVVTAPACSGTGVADAFNGEVDIYYNFVGEQLVVNMETPFAEISDILIYDALGSLRYQTEIAAGESTQMIDVSNLGTGLYVCKLQNKEGSINHSFIRVK